MGPLDPDSAPGVKRAGGACRPRERALRSRAHCAGLRGEDLEHQVRRMGRIRRVSGHRRRRDRSHFVSERVWTGRYPLRDTRNFLIVLKNHILVISECEFGGSELTDVKALVGALTLEEKAALTAGEDMLSTVGGRAARDPQGPRDRRPERSPGEFAPRCRWSALDVHPVRLRHRRQLGPGAGGGARGPRRARGARPRVPGTAGTHGEPAPVAAGRAQLRVLLRGPAALGSTRRRLRARRPVGGRLRDRQALRRERRRVRTLLHQLGDRRALAARALSAALRARRPRGRRTGDHDGLQPAQRALADPTAASSSWTSCATSGASRVW